MFYNIYCFSERISESFKSSYHILPHIVPTAKVCTCEKSGIATSHFPLLSFKFITTPTQIDRYEAMKIKERRTSV